MQRIVVMAENRIGVIAQIASTLAEGGVNLNSIATENEGQHGVVIITTDRTDQFCPCHPQRSRLQGSL